MMNPELILILIRAVNWIIKYYRNYNLHNPKWMDMNTSGRIVKDGNLDIFALSWTEKCWNVTRRKSQVLADVVFLRNKNE